jgi:tetratricopeptide (TPR) repeat protein
MPKKVLLLLIAVFAIITAKAQTAEEVYNRYLDFNLARLEGPATKAMELGEALLPDTAKLTPKARINFYYSIGKLYEDDQQSVKAQQFYQRVAAAVPNYYVVQRALGYIYAKQAEVLAGQLNATASNITENKRITALYMAAAKKAIPHLEKAQSCDPDDDTLTRINILLKNTKDTQGISNLKAKLAELSKSCIDLLDDK